MLKERIAVDCRLSEYQLGHVTGVSILFQHRLRFTNEVHQTFLNRLIASKNNVTFRNYQNLNFEGKRLFNISCTC